MNRPESAAYIAKARQSLREAGVLAENDLSDAAGRAAYLAAQAFKFDATGKTAKTHSGVRTPSAAKRARRFETPDKRLRAPLAS